MMAAPTDPQRTSSGVWVVVVGGLVLLHFLLHPWLTGSPAAPDLLLGGLLLAALRLRAGTVAVLGFALGVLEAAMVLGNPGVYALVLMVTGYAAARSRDVLFADAPLFITAFLFFGTWLARTALILFGAATVGKASAIAWALVTALSTAIVCGIINAAASSAARRG